jgi:beta-lactamase class A
MNQPAAQARGDENSATPRAATQLLEALYRSAATSSTAQTSTQPAISRPVAESVLATLKLRKNSSLPRLLPGNVEIANKPGGIEGAACDWGIVFVPNRPYVIAVMTNYIGEGAPSTDNAIARISKLAYDYFARLARSTNYGARVPLPLLQQKPD